MHAPYPTRACALSARLENRSVFTLDPRLKVSSYFFKGVNFTFLIRLSRLGNGLLVCF